MRSVRTPKFMTLAQMQMQWDRTPCYNYQIQTILAPEDTVETSPGIISVRVGINALIAALLGA